MSAISLHYDGITMQTARISSDNVDKNVFEVCRSTGLLGNQLNRLYIGVQNKVAHIVPSSDICLISVVKALHQREVGFASIVFVYDQLDPWRRNLICECQAPATASDRHRDLQHGIASTRSKRSFQIIDCTE